MRYNKAVDDLRECGERVDAASVAAVLTAEFQLYMGLLLMLLLLFRMFSPIAAVILIIPIALFSRRLFYSRTAFRENDDRFNTLLFYVMVTLVSVIILVGWRP